MMPNLTILEALKETMPDNDNGYYSLNKKIVVYVDNSNVSYVKFTSTKNLLAEVYNWSVAIPQTTTEEINQIFVTDSKPDLSEIITRQKQEHIETTAGIGLILNMCVDMRDKPAEVYPASQPSSNYGIFDITPMRTIDTLELELREEFTNIDRALKSLNIAEYGLFERGKFYLTLEGEERINAGEDFDFNTDEELAVLSIVSESKMGEPAYMVPFLESKPWMRRSKFIEAITAHIQSGLIEFSPTTGQMITRSTLAETGSAQVPSETIINSVEEETNDIDVEEEIEENINNIISSQETNLVPGNNDWDSILTQMDSMRKEITDLREKELMIESEREVAQNAVMEAAKEVNEIKRAMMVLEKRLERSEIIRQNAENNLAELSKRELTIDSKRDELKRRVLSV